MIAAGAPNGSSLGIGTVVGSEIFNHLCICAGSVFYAKGGVLVLDKAIVARETLFYGLALGLLLYVLMREHDGDNHIVIRWWAGPVLVAVYAIIGTCDGDKSNGEYCPPGETAVATDFVGALRSFGGMGTLGVR